MLVLVLGLGLGLGLGLSLVKLTGETDLTHCGPLSLAHVYDHFPT